MPLHLCPISTLFVEYALHGRTYLFVFAVNTAYPAAWATHSLLQFIYRSFDMFFSGFIFFDVCHPADPFIAGKGSEAFPYAKRFGVSG